MEIHWVHLAELPPEALRAAAERLHGLAEGHTDLIDVRIAAEGTRHHRHGARSVKIVCLARGQEIVASADADDVLPALEEALDDFERQVRELRRKRREVRSERPPLPPELGVVDRVFPAAGYGFVLTDDGTQVYFHRNAVRGVEFESLAEGDRVGVDIEPGNEGPQATALFPPPPDTPGP